MKLKLWLVGIAASSILSSASVALGNSCVTTTCHTAIKSFKNQHQPVQEGDCASCHVQKVKEHPIAGGTSFRLTAGGAALCSQCHDSKRSKKILHPPVEEGECIACHKPHGAAGRNLLDATDDQTAFCLGCHDSALIKHKFMHGPAAVGECTKCHDPHEANHQFLLKGTVRDVCLKCHEDFADAMKQAKVIHLPVRNEPCTVCHNPHGSAVSGVLKNKVPDLCVGCHENISQKLTGQKFPHKPVTASGGCSTCHSAHFAKAKGILLAEEKQTCLGCHDKDNLGTPPLHNLKKELDNKKYLHGPIQKGECKACHDPHGSNFFRMLRGNYPSELYMPYKDGLYDACLRCHDKNMLKVAETTTNTRFRNGSRNLHYVHVSNKTKGRSCRLCHEPHASNGEKLINVEGASFGAWKIPLNFKLGPTGGSCAPGCHREFKYDREKPEKY